MGATERRDTMGFNATWSMAVGGMVGGGIFSVLGVVTELAGPLAAVSFIGAGLVALATGHSYVTLAGRFGEGGGAFTFLRRSEHGEAGASLSWLLIVGYVLTMAVYAFTFGHYLGEVVGLGPLLTRLAAFVVIAALVGVNLRSVGDSATIEVVAVWGKLAVLVGLAVAGLVAWDPPALSAGTSGGGITGVIVGGASIFMAYEGFQLLTYDYDDIDRPDRTLPRAVLSAIAVVIVVYVLVAVGATMLVGAGTIIEQREVALAAAGEAALGTVGKVVVSVAAVLSTGSAINATLFATARLVRTVADDDELPAALGRDNRAGVPGRAVVVLGGGAAALAMVGALSTLVEAASLTFLVTFLAVNLLAARGTDGRAWIAWAGALGAGGAAVVLAGRLAATQPVALALLAGLALLATVGRRAAFGPAT